MRNKSLLKLFSFFFVITVLSCNSGPQPIQLGKDACSFCKMSIADKHFGGEIKTVKGKVFKFDDMHCILGFIKSNTVDPKDIKQTWLVNFNEPHNFIPAQKAFLLKSADLHSPMGGDVAAFETQKEYNDASNKVKGESTSWESLLNEK